MYSKLAVIVLLLLILPSSAFADRQIQFTNATIILKDAPCDIAWQLAEIVKVPELLAIKDQFKAADILFKDGNKLKACYLEDGQAIGIRDELGGAALVPAEAATQIPLPKGHQSTTGS